MFSRTAGAQRAEGIIGYYYESRGEVSFKTSHRVTQAIRGEMMLENLFQSAK